MNRLYARLNGEGLRSKIILQVHDELILEVVPQELETVKQLVKETMEGAAKLAVPLEVEEGTGKTWLDAH